MWNSSLDDWAWLEGEGAGPKEIQFLAVNITKPCRVWWLRRKLLMINPQSWLASIPQKKRNTSCECFLNDMSIIHSAFPMFRGFFLPRTWSSHIFPSLGARLNPKGPEMPLEPRELNNGENPSWPFQVRAEGIFPLIIQWLYFFNGYNIIYNIIEII